MNERFWEIDFSRGTAVVLMILFHILFDLNYFGVLELSIRTGFMSLFARFIAFCFIFIGGISLSISYRRASKSMGRISRVKKYLKRGGTIFGLGLVITAVTKLLIGEGAIVFGVLHFFGVATVLGFLVLETKTPEKIYPILALLFIGFWFWFLEIEIETSFLIPLGLMPSGFYTLDYFPIFPWFGVFLSGIFTGLKAYSADGRKFSWKEVSAWPTGFLSIIGRNSLLIYFLHQPVMLFFIYVLGYLG